MQTNNSPFRSAGQPARLEVVASKTNKSLVNSATTMNHHMQESVYKIVFESELDIRTLRQVARMFRMPETQILDIVRTQVRNRMTGPRPSGPSTAAWPQQRRAA